MGIRRGVKSSLFFFCLLVLSGCFPLSGAELEKLAEALAKDKATACLQSGGGGGGGAVPIVPIPVPTGGGGYGYLLACRSNQPGSEIEIKPDGTVTIKHGVYKTPTEEKEIQEMRDRLESYEKAPKVMLVPKPEEKKERSDGNPKADHQL